MKTINKMVLALLVMVFLAACNKNYYSGGGKGGKNCGCPSQKGVGGF